MKRLSTLLFAGAFVIAAGAASAETVKVGLIGEFSGPFAIYGEQYRHAIEAFQAVNGTSAGGNEIEIVYRDVGGPDPAKSRQLAEELILRDGVKFITGLTFTPNAMALSELITQAEMPTVIMNAATAVITRQSPYFVRVSMTLPQQTAPIAEWAADNGVETVVTAVTDYGPGHDAEATFISTFKARGGTILDSFRMPISTTDFAPFMERVLQAKPDAVFVFAPAGPPTVGAVNTWASRGLKDAGIMFLGTDAAQEILLPEMGQSAVGIITANQYTMSRESPENAALKDAIADKFGEDAIPDMVSVAAWDGMRLIYDAVAELGPDAEGEAYVDFMKGKEIDSPRGPIMIDPETRDIVQNIYIRRVVEQGGKLVNEIIATHEVVKDPWKQQNPPK